MKRLPNLKETDWFWLQQVEVNIRFQLEATAVGRRPEWHFAIPGEYYRPKGMGGKFRRLYRKGLVEEGPKGGIVMSKFGRAALKLWRKGT